MRVFWVGFSLVIKVLQANQSQKIVEATLDNNKFDGCNIVNLFNTCRTKTHWTMVSETPNEAYMWPTTFRHCLYLDPVVQRKGVLATELRQSYFSLLL